MDKKEKTKALELALGQIDKHFGKGAVMKLGDAQDVRVDSFQQAHLPWTLVLGWAGYLKEESLKSSAQNLLVNQP